MNKSKFKIISILPLLLSLLISFFTYQYELEQAESGNQISLWIPCFGFIISILLVLASVVIKDKSK